jgi:site-specific DNA recombinase
MEIIKILVLEKMIKKDDGKKRVVLYTRVSSDEQKKEGLSLGAQKRRLEEYADFKGWVINRIYSDEGISATSIKKRKAFKQMLEDAKAGKFRAILITKFDRAFRDTIDGLTTIDMLGKHKVDLVSISENIDMTTAMGRAMFTIIQAFAELEAKKTGERVEDILADKFEKGIIIGKPPLGYKWSKAQDRYIFDLSKVAMIKDIFLMTAQGKSYKEICAKHKIYHQKYYRIIDNKVYMGVIKYKGVEKKGSHDPIVTEEVFKKCQLMRKG